MADEVAPTIEQAEAAVALTWRIARGAYISAVVVGLLIIAGGADLASSDYYTSAAREIGVAFVTAGAVGVVLDPVARALRQAERLEHTIVALREESAQEAAGESGGEPGDFG